MRSIPACAGEPPGLPALDAGPAVYPRVCGGTSVRTMPACALRGLSPRVRGNPASPTDRLADARSIPACAGEPPAATRRKVRPGVYPRVCGGTRLRRRLAPPSSGLSPRVRGNPSGQPRLLSVSGSIPACAGEPYQPHFGNLVRRVYPRVCGGTSLREATVAVCAGLSPRVRGNRPLDEAPDARAGSIPACAGEPRRRSPGFAEPEVYPRVCGGTGSFAPLPDAHPGLSPRVRGNQLRLGGAGDANGSIPACAGEPGKSAAGNDLCEVYPRVCGGTGCWGIILAAPHGLSPRVRGNRQPCRLPVSLRRSIPACAGEPAPRSSRLLGHQVYPRVCGGTLNGSKTLDDVIGLSPRVRGNRAARSSRIPNRRSIPACAGEPDGGAGSADAWGVYPRVCGGTRIAARTAEYRKGLSPRVRGNQ